MKTTEELTAWLWNSPQKTHNEIYDALTAFAEEREKEAKRETFLGVQQHVQSVSNARAEGYAQGFSDARERAAKVMDFAAKETMMCGTVECQFYAKEIRALQPSEKGEEKND